MRTTLSLDDDVFAFVRAHAQRERISICEALSRLARQGIQAERRGPGAGPTPSPTASWLLALAVAQGGCLVTLDHGVALSTVAGATEKNLLLL